jgi:hypothetical protein
LIVFVLISHAALLKPKVKTMQDADGKQDRSCQQEAPQALSKAGKNVREPSGHAK